MENQFGVFFEHQEEEIQYSEEDTIEKCPEMSDMARN